MPNLPATGAGVQVKVASRDQRFNLMARATRTAEDGLRVPSGRILPLGTMVEVAMHGAGSGAELRMPAMVTGSQPRRGYHRLHLRLLPPGNSCA